MERNAKLVLVIFLLVGGGIRLWIAFQPVEVLCAKVTPDDAYYYFQTARQIVAGNGSTLDGVEPHNGYHPAWMGLILPVFAIVPDDLSKSGPESTVRLVLLIGALLNLLAAYILFRICMQLTDSKALSLLASFIHLFNPYVVFHSVDGLETSLHGLLLVCVLHQTLKPVLGEQLNNRHASLLGLLLGIMMLARTDSVLFAGPLLLVMLFTATDKKDTFRKLVLAGIISSVIVIPWLVWGRIYVGLWGQTSASAGPYELYLSFERNQSMTSTLWIEFKNMMALGAKRALILSPLGYLVVPSVVVAAIFAGLKRPEWEKLKIFIAPAIYCLLMLIVHAGLRWMPRSWYYAPLYLFECILVPLIIMYLVGENSRQQKSFATVAGLLFLIVFSFDGTRTWETGLWPAQSLSVTSARQTRQALAPGTKIGSSDAGIFSYFGPSGVVNLDGVVNESARRAIRQGRLLEYCKEKNLKLVGIRENLLVPEIMGDRFQLFLYPDKSGYMEIRDNPLEMTERFSLATGEIDFSKQSSSSYLLSGWASPDPRVKRVKTLAVFRKAEMALTIPTKANSLEIKLGPGSQFESRHLKLHINLDDTPAASYELRPGLQTLTLIVPPEKADSGIHIISFRFDFDYEISQYLPEKRMEIASLEKIIIIYKNNENLSE